MNIGLLLSYSLLPDGGEAYPAWSAIRTHGPDKAQRPKSKRRREALLNS
ncbi:hypothetical protein KCP73_10445 [Salmonella enterica subsp. enterica]|nr:hypothetical protein KCP73_10445 [Salmonella enterica subsp. enterica]